MRRWAMLCWVAGWAIGAAAQRPVRDFEPGHLLVKFRDSGSSNARRTVREAGATVVQELPALGVQRIMLPYWQTPEMALDYFRSQPNVEFAELNTRYQATFIPNDPGFPLQYSHQKMATTKAWDLHKGSPSIVIAIVDTGIDLTHEDLSGKIVSGYDFVNHDTSAQDDEGHGTHCAGIAAANMNNSKGVAGVAPQCSLMPVKVLNAQGSGYLSDVANGILWAADHGAKVISLSLGASSGAQTMQQAVDYAWGRGAVIVAAAGNSSVSFPSYPAYYTNCIAVGSTENNDFRSYFSNYGPWVDVAAPGSGILSTLPGSQYGFLDGTSMACPAVSGLAGLLYSYLGPQATNTLVRQRIENNCDAIGSWIVKGRVNAYRSMSLAAGRSLSDFTLSVSSVPGGGALTGTLTASSSTYSSVVINLSANGTALSFPPDVSIPAGQNSATFNLSAAYVQNPVTIGITAKLGTQSRLASVVVNPVAALSTFISSSYNVDGPAQIVGTLTISQNAPANGAVIPLSSSNGSILSVPPSVTIPAGQRTKTFLMSASNASPAQMVTVTGSYGGYQRQITVRVY